MLYMLMISLIAVGSAPVAQDAVPSSSDARAASAYEILLRAERVYDAAVGYAGESTPEYEAFAELVEDGRLAIGYARRLVRSARPAARAYGAILLIEIDRSAAESEFPRLEEEATAVEVMSGCLIDTYSISDIVMRLRAGEAVILTPSVKKRLQQPHSSRQLPN